MSLQAPAHSRDPRFSASLAEDGDRLVLELRGELDLGSAPELEAAIEALDGRPATTVVLDLSRLTFMDSSGLRAILTVDERMGGRGSRLVLLRGPRTVDRVFAITGADQHLTFVD